MKKYYCYKYVVLIILAIVLLGGCYSLLDNLGLKWIKYNQEATALPTSGKYWNDELNLYLNFLNEETTVQYANGKTEPIDVHPAGRLTNRDRTFNVWYSWNEEADEIILAIITYWEEYSEDRTYTFIRID